MENLIGKQFVSSERQKPDGTADIAFVVLLVVSTQYATIKLVL